MGTQNIRRFANAASIQRSTIHYNPPNLALQSVGNFGPAWLTRALWILLLVAAIAAAARAQDIYVSSWSQAAIIGKYDQFPSFQHEERVARPAALKAIGQAGRKRSADSQCPEPGHSASRTGKPTFNLYLFHIRQEA